MAKAEEALRERAHRRCHGSFVARHAGDQRGAATSWRSSSGAHTAARFSGSSGGICQPSFALHRPRGSAPASARRAVRRNAARKNARARRRPPAAPTAIRARCVDRLRVTHALPGAVCVKPGGQRQLRQTRDVVHAQLLHHGLAVTAHGLLAQVEHRRDFLAGLALGHQPQHLQLRAAKAIPAPKALAALPDRPSECASAGGRKPAGSDTLRPAATMRRASSRSMSEALLRMNARAPERMAPTTEFSSSYMERMTTLQSGWRRRISAWSRRRSSPAGRCPSAPCADAGAW